MWTTPLPSGTGSDGEPKIFFQKPGRFVCDICVGGCSKTGVKVQRCPSARVCVADTSLKPGLRNRTVCSPFSTMISAGVILPVSLPSTSMFAPGGLLSTTSVETAGLNCTETGKLFPTFTFTVRISGRKPGLEKTTMCLPAPRFDAGNGVTQVGSVQPSTSTFAPRGCESK